MKFFLLNLFLASSLIVFSQSREHSGSYEFHRGNNDNYFLKDMLTLNPNGTFLFLSESYIEERLQRKKKAYGKGTWTSDKNLIYLKVEDSDVDATHELNFNNTKLRYNTKSSRDKSNRDIKTSVRIIDTEISRFKGRTLIKDANTAPIIQEKECCNSIWQVHSYLQGKWENKSKENNEYHYSFKDEKGIFIAFEKNADGVLEEINKNPASVSILKTDEGYEIEQDFDGLKTYYGIKHLDAKKFVMVRRDGKESTLHRID
jgi:MFS superfamily sulfate permease-like transporter